MNTDWIKCDERDDIFEEGATFIKKVPNEEHVHLVIDVGLREWAGGMGYNIVVGEVDLKSEVVPWSIVPVFYPSIPKPYEDITDPKQLAKLWNLFRSDFIGMRIGVGDADGLRDELTALGIQIE